MIDVSTETLRSFPDAARRIGRGVHISTLHRWRLKGCRGVRLETVMLGGRRFTSDQALDRFFAATTAAADDQARSATPSEAAARKRHLQQVDAQLNRLGL